MLQEAIERNRRRWARYRRAERVNAEVQARFWDYVDMGKRDKARRVLARCLATLAPLYHAERLRADSRRARMGS